MNQSNEIKVSFTNICDGYTLGSCGNVNVIINRNCYINVTKLSSDYMHWFMLPESKELVAVMESLCDQQAPALISNEYSSPSPPSAVIGKYLNPYLVPHFATWVDPASGIKVSKIMTEYFIKRAMDEHTAKVAHPIREKNEVRIPKLDIILENQKKMMEQNEEMQNKLNCLTRVENIVPKTNIQNVFYIVKCNDAPVYNAKGDKIRLPEYYVIETKKKMLSIKFNNIKIRHPNMVVIHETTDVAIPADLWSILCGELRNNIEYDSHSFHLLDGYSEKRFLKYIKKFIGANYF